MGGHKSIIRNIADTSDGFVPFAPAHLGALGTVAVLCAAAAFLARRDGAAMRVAARVVAGALLVGFALKPFVYSHYGLPVRDSLPLQLCDLSLVACAVALLARRPLPFELAYFWGFSGTVQALVTPALEREFPHPLFLGYFALHGGVLVGVSLLLGSGLRPRRGAWLRAYGWTAVYAAGAFGANLLLDANYFFLMRKPPGSILEPFGPWPWYILAGAAVGLATFRLLDLPFRRSPAA